MQKTPLSSSIHLIVVFAHRLIYDNDNFKVMAFFFYEKAGQLNLMKCYIILLKGKSWRHQMPNEQLIDQKGRCSNSPE